MNKVLLPLLLIIVSVAAFFFWINPRFANVNELSVQLAASNDALDKFSQLETERSRLIDKKNSFQKSDLDKLQKLLPDNIDNIRLFLDIQGLASHYGTSIQDITIADQGQKSSSNQPIGASSKAYGQMTLGFSITTSYENLGLFMKDLEKSLRLVEIKSLSFIADNKAPNRYKVSLGINAFWLSPKNATKLISSK